MSTREPVAPRTRPGPLGGKRQENRVQKTRHIVRVARTLFIARGIDGVSVEDIMVHADLAKGSFYRYFRDKEQLVETMYAPFSEAAFALLARCDEEVRGASDLAGVRRVYEAMAGALTVLLMQHRDDVRLYLQERRGPAVGARRPIRSLADRLVAASSALTDVARARGLLRDPGAPISGLAVIGAAEQVLFAYLEDPRAFEPARAAAALVSLVLDGLRARPTRRR